MKLHASKTGGSTLVMTIVVVSTLLVLLAVAVDYSSQMSRNVERTRKTALAMEIADGHLEHLFTSWRNIYRTTWTTAYGANTGGTDYAVLPTNWFYTDAFKPGLTPAGYPVTAIAPSPIASMSPTATVPPTIPLPSSSLFPPNSNYTVTQYRIQAVDPMITLDSKDNSQVESGNKGAGSWGPMATNVAPPAAYGPTAVYGVPGFPYSFYYLAAADVTVPALAGNVTAKVRRVFEKRFDLPWTYAMFFVDDLEFQPVAPLTISGPVHTNGALYIGTSNFTAGSRVEYGTEYANSYSPYESRYGNSVTSPNFAKSSASLSLSDCPPAQVPPSTPFGWNLSFNNVDTGSGAGNNDGYREIIEIASGGTDDLAAVRYANQAGVQITIDSSNTVTVKYGNGSTPTNPVKTAVQNCITTNKVFYDNREAGYIRVVDLDIFLLAKAANLGDIPASTSTSSPNGWNGIVYVSDTSATTYNLNGTVKTAGSNVNVTYGGNTYQTTKRGVRLKNGGILPSTGLTVVSDNPVYIQGDYNVNPSGSTSNSANYPNPVPTPQSDVSPTASPAPSYVVSGTRKDAAIIADAITLLSSNWVDSNSTGSPTSANRYGKNTTVNAALIAGCSPSSNNVYGGGGENFVRFLEDWQKNDNYFTYNGSMVQFFRSQQAIGAWSGAGSIYKAPTLRWNYDKGFLDSAPPGNLQLAAYLQQQRWYQVY